MAIYELITKLLRTEIINNSFISLDLWSFIHFLSGAIILFLLYYLVSGFFKRLSWLITILVSFEIIEFLLYGVAEVPLISTETPINVLWDLIIGVLGGLSMNAYLTYKRIKKHIKK